MFAFFGFAACMTLHPCVLLLPSWPCTSPHSPADDNREDRLHVPLEWKPYLRFGGGPSANDGPDVLWGDIFGDPRLFFSSPSVRASSFIRHARMPV